MKVSVPSRIVIASRESRLAMWQAEHVQARLAALYPECSIDILGMTTRGDQILAIPTLVRRLPEPVRQIIGDLSNTERTLVGLNLRSIA